MATADGCGYQTKTHRDASANAVHIYRAIPRYTSTAAHHITVQQHLTDRPYKHKTVVEFC